MDNWLHFAPDGEWKCNDLNQMPPLFKNVRSRGIRIEVLCRGKEDSIKNEGLKQDDHGTI